MVQRHYHVFHRIWGSSMLLRLPDVGPCKISNSYLRNYLREFSPRMSMLGLTILMSSFQLSIGQMCIGITGGVMVRSCMMALWILTDLCSIAARRRPFGRRSILGDADHLRLVGECSVCRHRHCCGHDLAGTYCSSSPSCCLLNVNHPSYGKRRAGSSIQMI